MQSQQILQHLRRVIDDLPEDFYGTVEIQLRDGIGDLVRVNRTIRLQSTNTTDRVNGGAHGNRKNI